MSVKYIKSVACVTQEFEGSTIYLVHREIRFWNSFYCGYVHLPSQPVKETGYSGILVEVPVHGGITYGGHESDGTSIYGFDCAHAFDEDNPNLQDESWLIQECKNMKIAIELAGKYESEYDSHLHDYSKQQEVAAKFLAEYFLIKTS